MNLADLLAKSLTGGDATCVARPSMRRYVVVRFLLTILVSSVALAASGSTLSNNISRSALGAQAFDNGHWVEQAPPTRGFEYEAKYAIDDSYYPYWAGYGFTHPQQLWVVFDRQYTIDQVYINEEGGAHTTTGDYAFVTSGTLEYLHNGTWNALTTISKNTPDYLISFSPRQADGVRLTVYSSAQPPGWINKASAVLGFEVSAVPEANTLTLMFFGLAAVGLILRKRLPCSQ
jgi:hypothetical protein